MADPVFSAEEISAMRADARGFPAERREPVATETDEVVEQALDGGASPRDADSEADTMADTEGAAPAIDKGRRIAALVEAVRTSPSPEEGADEVVPFREEPPAAAADSSEPPEADAAGLEELDIEDAEEVVHEAPARPSLGHPPMPAAPVDWFEQIFDEDYLRILPPLDPHQIERELRFALDGLAVAQGSRLLDLGCGHGQHATALQARGYDVVGLDSSMVMLTYATEEARRRGLGPSLVHGDMRALALDGEFDGVLCIHGTFGYFDEEENERIAGNVFKALRPGGRLVLSVPNRDYFVGDLPARICWEAHGSMVLEEVDFDFFKSRLEVRRSIAFEEGRQAEHRYSVRVYSMHEITRLLERAGFGVISAAGHISTPGTFLGPYSRSIWIFAQKP